MKKHLPSAIILSALLLVLCLHAFAVENAAFDSGDRGTMSTSAEDLLSGQQESGDTDSAQAVPTEAPAAPSETLPAQPDITVNGISIGHSTPRTTVEGVPYVAAAPILEALYPHLVLTQKEDCLIAAAVGMTLCARAGDNYIQVNGRYLYVPNSVLLQEETLFLPAETLCQALGCSLQGADTENGDLVICQVEDPISPKVYDEEDLYWLSRAIYSESGNQPMKGRIAVGTVILNRVADPTFPNSIEEVIFAPGQFSPVANGTIYREPDQDSVVAAQLCLDGVKEADDCLYFNVTSMRSWADRSRTYVCTIGGHNFYL